MRDDLQLGDLGERRIYREMLAPRYGIVEALFGDDCAALGRDLVVTTDTCPTPMVAQLGETDPYYTGWLLGTINLSDLAAAGAAPMGLVVNYTLPAQTRANTLDRIMQGVDDCAASHGTRVLGGDMRDGREMHLSATAIGRVTRRRFSGRWSSERLSRRGARAGDVLLLVGNPGYLWGAAMIHRGWADVDHLEQEQVFARARRPIAQLEAGRLLASRGLTRAAIDVSDGLFASVGILADCNGLSAVMDSKIALDPVLARVCEQAAVNSFQLGQTWGDWCLLVAVRPAETERAERLLRSRMIGVRRVGQLLDRTDRHMQVASDNGLAPWEGIDQERFSANSWHGDGIDEHIARMRSLS